MSLQQRDLIRFSPSRKISGTFPKTAAKSEYDNEIPKSHTADQHTAPCNKEPQNTNRHKDIKKTIKVKQPALSSSSR